MMSSEKSPFDLTGRRIVIAGAAGGIGSVTAKLCAQQGATLVLVDIAGKDRIRERVGAELADRSDIHSLDTGSRADVTALAKRRALSAHRTRESYAGYVKRTAPRILAATISIRSLPQNPSSTSN
jgi:NAD(P)-dependent dehydrogenase (short-subunit alcohol dehydrogenase family)